MAIAVVSDTSPIRTLNHLGRLDLLEELLGDVVIPPAVMDELQSPLSGLPPLSAESLGGIRVQAPEDRTRVSQFRQTLDLGESEALALALELNAVIVIDEAKGRTEAVRIGLSVIGVLGLLLRAKQKGLIELVRPSIDRLQSELGFFISATLRAEILHTAGE